MEVKYERLPQFCCGYGVITHETRLCEFAKGMCIDFGWKNGLFGKWIRPEINMVVPLHVKEGAKRRQGSSSVPMNIGELVASSSQFAFAAGNGFDKVCDGSEKWNGKPEVFAYAMTCAVGMKKQTVRTWKKSNENVRVVGKTKGY